MGCSDRTSQKNQKRFFSRKKKTHTLKSQVIVDQATGEIVCTARGRGKEHDFRLFKTSKVRLRANIECLGDKGYQSDERAIGKDITHLELMWTEKFIENWYEVQRNLYLQVAREFVLRHIIQKLEV